MNVSDFSFNVEDMREWVNYCNDIRTYINPQVEAHSSTRQQALMTLQTTYWAMVAAAVYHDLWQSGKTQEEALETAQTVQAVGMTKVRPKPCSSSLPCRTDSGSHLAVESGVL